MALAVDGRGVLLVDVARDVLLRDSVASLGADLGRAGLVVLGKEVLKWAGGEKRSVAARAWGEGERERGGESSHLDGLHGEEWLGLVR